VHKSAASPPRSHNDEVAFLTTQLEQLVEHAIFREFPAINAAAKARIGGGDVYTNNNDNTVDVTLDDDALASPSSDPINEFGPLQPRALEFLRHASR
jgi:hypothetical protein